MRTLQDIAHENPQIREAVKRFLTEEREATVKLMIGAATPDELTRQQGAARYLERTLATVAKW